ncbi:MAG: hypothetical protein ABSG04_00750 [Verrucomicrobiota bacterium]|jgi:hypothetical protein
MVGLPEVTVKESRDQVATAPTEIINQACHEEIDMADLEQGHIYRA